MVTYTTKSDTFYNLIIMQQLQDQFGNIDIYLFDQLLKGRFDTCEKVLDAGCGNGRNLVYFLKQKRTVYGIDQSAYSIEQLKNISLELNPENNLNNFVVGAVEDLPFEEDFFDLVLANAILHFAKNRQHFESMLHAIWKVLKDDGYLLVRLASNIGIENLVKPLADGRYLLPDGSTRYLVDQEMLLRYTQELGGELVEPIKTTNVQNWRCMTTWCVQKKAENSI